MTKNLIDKIIVAKTDSERDLSTADYKTRPSLEMRRNQAGREHKELVKEYKTNFSKTVFKVFLGGTTLEHAKKLTTILAKEKITSLVLESIYSDIAGAVWVKLSTGNTYSTPAFNQLQETLSLLSNYYQTYPHTLLSNKGISTSVRNQKELTELVKTRVRESFGDTLNSEHLHDQAFKKALDSRFEGDFCVVLVPNLSDDERAGMANTLFPGRPSFSVDLEGEAPNRTIALKIVSKITAMPARPTPISSLPVSEDSPQMENK